MSLKELLYEKRIKQVELAKTLGLDTGRVSLLVNGVRPWPVKYRSVLCKFIGITDSKLTELLSKGHKK